MAARKIVRRSCLGARPRYNLVVDEDVKKPNKQTNKQAKEAEDLEVTDKDLSTSTKTVLKPPESPDSTPINDNPVVNFETPDQPSLRRSGRTIKPPDKMSS